jgi:hypothetical protein
VLDPAGPGQDLPVFALIDRYRRAGRVEHDAP